MCPICHASSAKKFNIERHIRTVHHDVSVAPLQQTSNDDGNDHDDDFTEENDGYVNTFNERISETSMENHNDRVDFIEEKSTFDDNNGGDGSNDVPDGKKGKYDHIDKRFYSFKTA